MFWWIYGHWFKCNVTDAITSYKFGLKPQEYALRCAGEEHRIDKINNNVVNFFYATVRERSYHFYLNILCSLEFFQFCFNSDFLMFLTDFRTVLRAVRSFKCYVTKLLLILVVLRVKNAFKIHVCQNSKYKKI